MRIYESVLDVADVGVGAAYNNVQKLFIIKNLRNIFLKACHLSVQIIYPGYSIGRTTGLSAFSCVRYRPFDESDCTQ